MSLAPCDGTGSLSTVQLSAVAWHAVFTRDFKAMVPVIQASSLVSLQFICQLCEFVTLFMSLAPCLDGTVSLSTVQVQLAAVAWRAVFTRDFKAMAICHWSEQHLFL